MDSFDQAVKLICSTGTAPDWDQVRKLFEQAAREGHARAQFNLGVMYAKGLGTAYDKQSAYDWFARAAAQGHRPARQALSRYFQHATEERPSPAMGKLGDATRLLPEKGSALQDTATAQSGAPDAQKNGINHGLTGDWQHAGTLDEGANQSHRSFAMMLATLICVISIVLVRGYFSLL